MLLIALLSMLGQTPEQTWRDCVDRTATNPEWARCGGDYITSADALLNAEWRRLMAAVDGETRKAMIAEQRAWLAYRETACRFYDSGDWGREEQVLHYPGCVAGVIERRTAELASYRAFVKAE